MFRTFLLSSLVVLLALSTSSRPQVAVACCPAGATGKSVVNADQSVIIIWDGATKTQHFIRRASFKSEGDDFGFLIPSPSRPELAESGNDAFPYLQKLTEPEVIEKPRPRGGSGCGCQSRDVTFQAVGENAPKAAAVRVLEEKVVAGFNAKVLEADTTEVLVQWLKENGYAYSPEVAAWVWPYVEGKWKITALKVAKKKDEADKKDLTVSALRMSFKTDRPLFPYREPDSTQSAASLGASRRLLRIYFIGDGRHQGSFTAEPKWTGNVAWAGPLSKADRTQMLKTLGLPETTGPAEWWLTEFEDNWPYKVAPSDVYFTRSDDQTPVKREPIVRYVSARSTPDAMPFVMVAAMALMLVGVRLRSRS